jgi:hypothetical protein
VEVVQREWVFLLRVDVVVVVETDRLGRLEHKDLEEGTGQHMMVVVVVLEVLV